MIKQLSKRHNCSVALIQTIEKIRFGPMVMPVGLSPDRITGANLTAVMAGFGQTRVIPRTDVKQFLKMQTMTNADCRRFYRMFPFNAARIFDSNICLYNDFGRGTCGGDKIAIKISLIIFFYRNRGQWWKHCHGWHFRKMFLIEFLTKSDRSFLGWHCIMGWNRLCFG